MMTLVMTVTNFFRKKKRKNKNKQNNREEVKVLEIWGWGTNKGFWPEYLPM